MFSYVLILSNHANGILTLYLTFIVQAPSRRIWVRICDENQAISLSQKHLEGVELVDDLKGAIKERLKSSLGDVSEERITIYRGETILEEDTPISELYNTKDDALEIAVDGKHSIRTD